MAFTFVTKAQGSGSDFFPCSVSLSVQAGDLVVVCAANHAAPRTQVIGGTQSGYINAWGGGYADWGDRFGMWSNIVASTSGSFSVTLTTDAGDSGGRAMSVLVFRGVDTGTPNDTNVVTASTYSVSLTTGTNNALIVAVSASTASTPTKGASYSAGHDYGTDALVAFATSEYLLDAGSAGSKTVDFSNATGQFVGTASFNLAGGTSLFKSRRRSNGLGTRMGSRQITVS